MQHHNQERLSKMGQMLTLAVLLVGFALGIVWAMIAVGGQSIYVGKAVYAVDKEKSDNITNEIRMNMRVLFAKNGLKWEEWKNDRTTPR